MDIDSTIKVSQAISEHGITIVICAVFLVMSSMLMIACFSWLKGIMEKIMGDYSEKLTTLQNTANKSVGAMIDIAEGLVPETQLRIKNISNVYFDLAIEKVCRLIKKIREENHIIDKEATKAKINTLLTNLYADRNSRFDCFNYRGKPLSSYSNPEWIDWVSAVVESEIYNEMGANNSRAYTNVQAIYDNIKLDFYHRLND